MIIILCYSYALTYMRDLEQECMLLGIPVKRVIMRLRLTSLSLRLFLKRPAVDHNCLLMDVMRSRAS
jgi:glutamine synthetase